MELIRGLHNLRHRHRPCVATLGNFDGVHLGHQTVLGQLREQARIHGVPSAVVLFEPLPLEFIVPEKAPPRLMTLREKLPLLRELGIDRALLVRFDEQVRSLSARQFTERVLVDGLGVRSVILGDDFRFGRGREGDADFVRAVGRERGFEVHPTDTFELDGARVSSTRLREALGAGDFVLVRKLLGRDYSIKGRVMPGRKLGRELGAPTANIALRRRSTALSGVFAVRVHGAGLTGAEAVANVGVRPSIEAGLKPNLEVHVLDRSIDLYGECLEVRFLARVRDEKKFSSLEQLQRAISHDRDCVRAFFERGAEEPLADAGMQR